MDFSVQLYIRFIFSLGGESRSCYKNIFPVEKVEATCIHTNIRVHTQIEGVFKSCFCLQTHISQDSCSI